MSSEAQVLIAGAGIGGLTAALALLRKGCAVRVYEQAFRLGEVGAGLQLSPNSVKALWRLGLKDALNAIAHAPTAKEIRMWNTGRAWRLFDLGQASIELYGHPYLMVYRPDLHRILVDAVQKLDPGAIRLGRRCIGFEQAAHSVTMLFADGSRSSGEVLIGADGVHSAVRDQLYGNAQPRFTGCIAWRGVIQSNALSESMHRPVGTNWVGPGAHVVHYPIQGGQMINFVGVVEHSDHAIESWSEQGTHQQCHGDFAGWHDDVHELIRNIRVPYKWALMEREPLKQWSRHRVALLGDASHPTLPFLAQGAAMAIEDGYILARCIEKYREPQLALKQYEGARIERTSQVVIKSAENGKRFHSSSLAHMEDADAYIEREWSEAKIYERYDWLFRYDVDQVAV